MLYPIGVQDFEKLRRVGFLFIGVEGVSGVSPGLERTEIRE